MAEFIDISEEVQVEDESERNMEIADPDVPDGQNIERRRSKLEDECKKAEQSKINFKALTKELQEIMNSLLQQKVKLLGIEKDVDNNLKHLTSDIETLLEETRSKISKFREAYKNCESALQTLFKSAEKNLKMSKNSVFQHPRMRSYFSTIIEEVTSNKMTLALSKKAFDEFESLAKDDLKKAIKGKNDEVSRLIIVINKASSAFEKFRSITLCN